MTMPLLLITPDEMMFLRDGIAQPVPSSIESNIVGPHQVIMTYEGDQVAYYYNGTICEDVVSFYNDNGVVMANLQDDDPIDVAVAWNNAQLWGVSMMSLRLGDYREPPPEEFFLARASGEVLKRAAPLKSTKKISK